MGSWLCASQFELSDDPSGVADTSLLSSLGSRQQAAWNCSSQQPHAPSLVRWAAPAKHRAAVLQVCARPAPVHRQSHLAAHAASMFASLSLPAAGEQQALGSQAGSLLQQLWQRLAGQDDAVTSAPAHRRAPRHTGVHRMQGTGVSPAGCPIRHHAPLAGHGCQHAPALPAAAEPSPGAHPPCAQGSELQQEDSSSSSSTQQSLLAAGSTRWRDRRRARPPRRRGDSLFASIAVAKRASSVALREDDSLVDGEESGEGGSCAQEATRARRHTRRMQMPVASLAVAEAIGIEEQLGGALVKGRQAGSTLKEAVQAYARQLPINLRRLMAGGIAGALSKTATAPIETIRMQVMSGKHGAVGDCIARTWRRKGVLGFFSGNSADILRVMPSKAVELAAFDLYKTLLSHRDQGSGETKRPGALLTGVAGAAAGATATVGLYPLETIRTHLAEGEYRSIAEAARGIVQEEGVSALYNGITASLIGVLPYAALRLGLYDGFKWSYSRMTGEKKVPPPQAMAFGALAGLLAATATFPVEVVRRRMMMGTVKGNTFTAIGTIAQREGWGALYKGVLLTWVKQIPQNAVSMAGWDLLKQYLDV